MSSASARAVVVVERCVDDELVDLAAAHRLGELIKQRLVQVVPDWPRPGCGRPIDPGGVLPRLLHAGPDDVIDQSPVKDARDELFSRDEGAEVFCGVFRPPVEGEAFALRSVAIHAEISRAHRNEAPVLSQEEDQLGVSGVACVHGCKDVGPVDLPQAGSCLSVGELTCHLPGVGKDDPVVGPVELPPQVPLQKCEIGAVRTDHDTVPPSSKGVGTAIRGLVTAAHGVGGPNAPSAPGRRHYGFARPRRSVVAGFVEVTAPSEFVQKGAQRVEAGVVHPNHRVLVKKRSRPASRRNRKVSPVVGSLAVATRSCCEITYLAVSHYDDITDRAMAFDR